MSRRSVLVSAFAVTTVALGLLTPTAAAAPSKPANTSQLQVVATGLNNPRHLEAHGDTLYVAEAGTGGPGPCAPSPEGVELCAGRTGSVAAIRHGHVQRIVTGLSSLAAADGSNGFGTADVAMDGCTPYVVVQDTQVDQTGGNPFGRNGKDLGYVLRGNRHGNRHVVDLAHFEATHDPDGGAGAEPGHNIDSDPYSITRYREGFVVTDAAANDLLYVDKRGHVSVLAVFPVKSVPGVDFPIQSVTTSATVGPDGALYVSELSIIPGTARVYRAVPGHAPTIYADGFTAVSDLAFDRHGRLLVLELARDSIINPPSPGVLLRVERNGSRTTLASEGLESTTGLAVSGDDVYIANHGTSAGTGEILRLRTR
jgi:hypothetical protein